MGKKILIWTSIGIAIASLTTYILKKRKNKDYEEIKEESFVIYVKK